jgi:O-6-methylguanine DNA methyltransferase
MRNYSKTGGKKGMPAYRTPSSFKSKVYKIVSQIPKGKTLTYKRVAELSGKPKAWRAVGNILNKNHNPEIPCHRVICSNGETGGYNRGESRKKDILKKEGAIK